MAGLRWTLAGAGLVAAAATAQMNPANIGRGLVMPSAINAQAAQDRPRHQGDNGAMSDAQYCASIPEYRRTLGAHSEKVRRLTALCKQAGYPTGDQGG